MAIVTLLNLMFLCGSCRAGQLGKVFVTIFMQNNQPGNSPDNFQVFVNSYYSGTVVTMWTNNGNFRRNETMRELSTFGQDIPTTMEFHGIQMSKNVLVVQSDKDISVLAMNYKPNSSDVTSLLPFQDWGKEYYVLTPLFEGSKQFSVVSGAEKTSVEIQFTTTMVIKNTTFKPGETFSFVLERYTAYQFISDSNLSGTRVVSQQPVAVLCGLACTTKNVPCRHVFEQLLPVSLWGRNFIVTPVTSQTRPDIIYVMASQATRITHQSDLEVTSIDLRKGEVMELSLNAQTATFISANAGIQVFHYCTGGTDLLNTSYNPFLVNVPSISSYCSSFYVFGEDDFDNYGSIVAKTSEYSRITFNRKTNRQLTWVKVPGTEYSWTTQNLEKGSKVQLVESPLSPILMMSYGIAKKNSYESVANCMNRNTVTPCTSAKCRSKEKCQVISGKAVCVPLYQSYCWAAGDPHYRTFDDYVYDFQGTCTYTFAKTCGKDKNLMDFNIEVMNENRGNSKVSYVSTVRVQTYGLNVTIARYEQGFIRLNDQLQRLPVLLHNGKVRVYQSGTLAVVWTDFSLIVYFDWHSMVTAYLSSSYYENVCGLCGTYNGNPDDDLTMSTGAVASNLADFGKSWRVDNGSRLCWDDCHGECLTCPNEKQKMYESKEACGLISMAEGGPFKDCHSTINPKIYMENCVYDLCINDGLRQILCQSLKAYVDICQRNKIRIGDWRTLSGCTLQCPEYSQYKLCGNACPPTCNDNALPTKCPDSCVETCECRTGFFLDKAECILKMSCGCVSMGRQYAINDKFWGDNECKNRCMCNPATKKVECNPHQCKSSEKCSVLNGIQNCYPLAYGICSAYGDSHYVTFDGVRYDFHGSCIYQLVGVCKKSEDLVDFQVNIQNYNKGGKMISFVTFVQVKIFGLNIDMSRQYRHRIMVNGILVNLPFSAESGKLSVYNNGISINLRTTFGLLVTLSWKTRITVTVPSTYVGATCGLCANFNSDTDNEFMMSNNEVASTAARFGKSWNVEAVPECSEDAKGKCHKLDEFEKLYRSSNESCGMIIDKSGPFRECHNIVNPEDFFKTCILDACYYNALKDIICMVITNYVAACQEARAIVFPWRASTFCSPVCGENSHYELCAPGCSPSCPMLSSPLGCNSVCSEGCVCDDGYIFSGGDCVPISQCGCKYMDKYYKLGEVFFPNLLCDQQCVCPAGGVVQCKPFTCGITKKCTVVDGIQKCQSVGSAQCSAMGDPHYFSFDGLYYDFQGNCVYTLSKMVNKNDDLIPFEIKVKNEKWGNGRVSVTKTVGLEVYGYTLILQYNMPGQILVNGLIHNLPLILEEEKIQVYQHGLRVDIDTNFGVKVSYDLFYHVIVSVSSIYKGQVGGLCGNYNGDIKDEFQQPDQTLAPNATSFGASWKVDIKGEICDHGCGGTDNPCPMCDGRRRELFKADNYCGLLKKNRGPLSACFGIINPDNYYNSCLFDLCSSSGIVDIRCHNIQSYVAVCQAAGVTIQPWRTDFFCPLTCPANSRYKVCADVCTSSCAAITESIQCPVSCLEGCQCDENFYFDGRECVSVDKCGCFAKGTYYQLLETVLRNDCKTICICNSTNNFICKNNSCASDQQCKNVNGIMKCVSEDLCKSTKCRIKETCKVEQGKSVCVPNFTGTCYAWGDPHYQSYDDYNYDFQGTCTYVLSKYIGSDPTLVPFTIEEKNDNRGSQAVSFVRAVTIYVYGYKVSLLKGESGKARINDVIFNLPVTLLDGKISISMSGFNAVLRTNFGLQVSYEYSWHVAVTLPSSYYGATGGLCGNFNQDPKDEMITQDNKLVTSIVDWCKSWKVNDSDPLCFDVCPGICPSCDEVDKSLYESEIFCGLIKKMAQGGPFRECHPIIDPQIFFINCVYDVCIYDGAKQILCQALTAYADTCRSHGAKVYDWRTPSNCVLKCPENSYFEFCGSACPATCSQQRLPAECSMDHCVETCQCEEGFILSADKCIPVGSCGCKYNGAYYLPNQQFWEDDYCHVLCKCESNSGFVHCVPSNCTENERCMVVHGVRGCQPISFSTCFIMEGLHYKMFDSQRFIFVGTSIYQLVGITSNDSSLIPFTVLIEYDNCGSQAITHPKVVSLLVYGMIFSLSVDFPSRILINGTVAALPLYYQGNKVVAYLSGSQGIIKTNIEVTIIFDWSSFVLVTVPSTYSNAVGGLCGNNNKNASDDFTMKNGTVATDEKQFGDSWKIGDINGDSPNCTGNPPQCSDTQKQKYVSDQYCGIITRSNGPFNECSSIVDPTPYLNDCVLDTCLYDGHPVSFCTAIGVYMFACQAAGVRVRDWRSDTFCPLSCPKNSHYELCGNGCPTTCYGLSAPVGCIAQCKEGCYCDNGFILSGHKCLPISDCGCVYQERYFQKHDVFYPDDRCNISCRCQDNGVVVCEKSHCGNETECSVVKGVRGCDIRYGTCVAYGGSHYITYDGHSYVFHGTCTYTLSEATNPPYPMPKFSVVVTNERYREVSVTRMVAISLYDHTITFERRMEWKVKVDGVFNNLPLTLLDGGISVNQEGNNIILQSDFGLQVLYDRGNFVLVNVPNSYSSSLVGLCGNFNGVQKDDLKCSNNEVTTNVDTFGASWKVNNSDINCNDSSGKSCPACDKADNKSYTGPNACGMIISHTGPFKDCHKIVNPEIYYSACIYELCITKKRKNILCRSLKAYTAACQKEGASVLPWRTPTLCPFTCSANSLYQPCTMTCAKTCTGLISPRSCTVRCFEGCECKEGFLFDGYRCVLMPQCGCLFNGKYLKNGESVMTLDCKLRCTCQVTVVNCTKITCGEKELCGIRNGVRNCHSTRNECSVNSNEFITFDGLAGEPLAPGCYDIVTLCNRHCDSWFRIVAHIQRCDTQEPLVAKLHIFLTDSMMTVTKDQEVWVNGRPASSKLQLSSLSFTRGNSSISVLVVRDLSLELTRTGALTVNVLSGLDGATCGACGNYNRDKADDLLEPRRNIASNITIMTKSWAARDFCSCSDT